MRHREGMSSTTPIALVTGGNSGIGKHTAIGLLRKGYRVVITSRDPERGAAAIAEIRELSGHDAVECLPLDLARFASIRACAREVLSRYDRLDRLVNNAGLVLSERQETEEGFEMTFGVNHLGHFLLTTLLLERLEASAPARITNLSSHGHKGARNGLSFDDLQQTQGYQAMRAYCESKLANIYFTRQLALRLEGTGVTAHAVHPGVVASNFARDGDVKGVLGSLIPLFSPFMLSESKGAATSIYAATAPEVAEHTGGYFAKCRLAKTSSVARDDDAAARLWEISEAMIEHGGPVPA